MSKWGGDNHESRYYQERALARILYTWELGAGLGHIVPYIPLAKRLQALGHEVLFAVRDLKHAEDTLGKHGIPYVQAPLLLGNPPGWIEHPHIFAQVLANMGYGSVDLLAGLASGWRQLVRHYGPDLILYNHSPTALLATREMDCRKVIIGTGFHMPPDSEAPFILRDLPKPEPDRLAADNALVVDNVNRVLEMFGSAPLERITQLYRADEKVVLSFREMDHYSGRNEGDVRYWGPGSGSGGVPPQWPGVGSKRVFAYLKPFRTLSQLLEGLGRMDASTLIYAPGVDMALKQKYSGTRLSFSNAPLDMHTVSRECDVAITNATHATSTAILQAGKPQLMLPLNIEQFMVSQNVEKLGAGLAAPRLHPEGMLQKLDTLFQDECYRLAAESFADRYRDFDADEMESRLASHIDSLIVRGGG